MSREEILKDIKFRQVCNKYGVDGEFCEIYDEVISLNQVENIYILLDKNYNTICIDKLDSEFLDVESFVDSKYNEYCNFTDILPYGDNFGYPFEEYTLKQIIELSNRVEIIETNHGHSLKIKVNGNWYDRDVEENENHFKLLSYIKFLAEEIQQYFLLKYRMQVMGFEMPDVYSYVRQLIRKVNKYVDYYLVNRRRPYPVNILNFIGQNADDTIMNGIFFDAIDLLINDKGFKIDSEDHNSTEKVSDEESTLNLSELAREVLNILDLPDEELKEKGDGEKSLILKPSDSFDSSFEYWLYRITNIPSK